MPQVRSVSAGLSNEPTYMTTVVANLDHDILGSYSNPRDIDHPNFGCEAGDEAMNDSRLERKEERIVT